MITYKSLYDEVTNHIHAYMMTSIAPTFYYVGYIYIYIYIKINRREEEIERLGHLLEVSLWESWVGFLLE